MRLPAINWSHFGYLAAYCVSPSIEFGNFVNGTAAVPVIAARNTGGFFVLTVCPIRRCTRRECRRSRDTFFQDDRGVFPSSRPMRQCNSIALQYKIFLCCNELLEIGATCHSFFGNPAAVAAKTPCRECIHPRKPAGWEKKMRILPAAIALALFAGLRCAARPAPDQAAP